MKKNLFLLLLITGVYTGNAQTKAITDVGDEVLLYSNGTWKYVNEKAHPSNHDSVNINKTPFVKDKLATFLVKSKIINAGIYIVPGEWEFKKGELNEIMEYHFRMKEKDSYAFAVTEKMEIPLENMPGIVLENVQKKAPDAEIIKTEYRMVNGVKVLCLKYKGSITGMKFMWLGYYYSSAAGTIQLVAGTSENLFNDNYKILENFLNGFVVL